MTDAADRLPTSQAIEARDRSAPLKVTGRLKHAIDLMVWKGLTRDEAAKEADIKPHSLYVAFRKSHVKAHYLAELGALRDSERAKTFHRLTELRDQDENKNAAVAAAKALEAIPDDPFSAARAQQTPGVTIRLITALPARPAIDVTPPPKMIEQEPEERT